MLVMPEKRGTWRRFVCKLFGHEWTPWLSPFLSVLAKPVRVRACYRCHAEERLVQ